MHDTYFAEVENRAAAAGISLADARQQLPEAFRSAAWWIDLAMGAS